jgi:hypothetical protein
MTIDLGKLTFMLHDNGWFVAWRSVIWAEARWPRTRKKPSGDCHFCNHHLANPCRSEADTKKCENW